MNRLKQLLKDKYAVIGITVLFSLLIVAIFAPMISPGNPLHSVGSPIQKPSVENFFGTDEMGRDVFAMIVWGSRISMQFALGAAGLSLIIGVVLGALSGYIGGTFDDLLSRTFEIFYVIPVTFLIILMVAIFGSSVPLMITIVGLTIWPTNARIMRAQVLTLKDRSFVHAGDIAGSGKLKILFKHIVPNGMGPVLTNSMLQMAQAVLIEASLSFLGLGDPSVASWGKILQSGQGHISSAPWLVLIPGFVIAAMLLSFNLFGTALERNLDVRQQMHD
ncbi:ABC transporter permease [Virgibacillus halodenitrificans]|uniref:ABC transporter permease n=1 Tax=Virgibacillus halodenitrificans TaxID=1482 RepID=UPI00045C820B|nr:ABC transporter permease [Virgibacillus halodenitrificans]CDQ32064.1 Stage 0 sporulation protein KC [Virgibacillus halodenitrificans]